MYAIRSYYALRNGAVKDGLGDFFGGGEVFNGQGLFFAPIKCRGENQVDATFPCKVKGGVRMNKKGRVLLLEGESILSYHL